jgi:TolB-like protein/predicted Ser/Thr protein kinase
MGPGLEVSHYRIVGKLGEGGMGVVWKAEDVHMQRVVALKFLHASDDLARLLREAQTAGSLNHPNICTVYEVDPERGFLAMELVEGRTLKDVMGGRPLPAEQALGLALQIGEGLKAAHEKGITHRDIKSANIIVNAHGQAKILDFGLARMTGQDGLTREGAAAGTPGYMAPEQMRGEPVDRRTDIWAFGAVLHEMLTGRLPIGSLGVMPQGVDRAVGKALAADPDERYQHIDDMLVDLRNWQGPPARRSRRWLIAGAGATAASIAGAVLLQRKFARKSYSSLAVLPMENLSGDAGQEWFSDGMTETLISELSKVRSLKVIARTSVMQYKKQPKPVKTVARELDVEVVVEGAAHKAGDRAHIMARLIDASTERQLWSEDFDRDAGDVITLHRELARAIAREIRVTLKADEQKGLSAARRAKPDAVEAVLRGEHLRNQSPRNLPEVLKLAREAVRLDPEYARGHLLLARTLQGLGDYARAPYAEVIPESRAALKKALEAEPDLAEAYTALSWSLVTALDWEGAEAAARKARDLDPSADISSIVFARGRVEEALAENRRQVLRDPLSVTAITNVGRHLATLGRFDEALEWHRKAVAIEPENSYALAFLERTAHMAGRNDEAVEAALRGALPEHREKLRAAYRSGGWMALWKERLRLRISLPNQTAQQMARVRMFHGIRMNDHGMALDALETLEKTGDSWLAQFADGNFHPLRQEPRFKAVLKRLRYPESMWK